MSEENVSNPLLLGVVKLWEPHPVAGAAITEHLGIDVRR